MTKQTENQDPTFETYEVIGPQPIQFFGGTRIRLSAKQYERRAQQVHEVEEVKAGDETVYDVTVKEAITLKVKETFGFAGEIPKAYYASVGFDGIPLLDHLAKQRADEDKQRLAGLASKRATKAAKAKAAKAGK